MPTAAEAPHPGAIVENGPFHSHNHPSTEKQVPAATLVGPVQCIAHRGFAGVAPENTLRAVRAAVDAGADAVEVDVRRCASGDVVCCHDETVDRVTDGTGAVADLTRAELADLDVLGSGAGVPPLAAVVEAVPPEVGLNVELKERGIASDVLDHLAGTGGDWWLSSFDIEAIRTASRAGRDRASIPDPVPVAPLVAPGRADPLAAATGTDAVAVHPHQDLCTPDLVTRAHDAGLAVTAWTVRSEVTARGLREAGVDGLIADAPAYCAVADDGGSDTGG